MIRTWLTIIFWLSSASTQGQTLTVVTEDWPTFNYHDENGQIVGESTENVREILELANVQYDMNLYPWARTYHIALTQPNTLIFTISKTASREKLFHWFCPISRPTPISLYRLTENKVSLTTLEDAKSYTIGVMRNDNSHQLLKDMGFEEGKQLDVSSIEGANINKLFAKRVDLIVQSDNAIEYRLDKLERPADSVKPVILLHQTTPETNCMALSLQSDPALHNKIRDAFEQWHATKSTQ